MAQFDIYPNRNPETRESIPYLLDVQADMLDVLATRIVIPLYHGDAIPKPARHLNPVVEVDGRSMVLSTAELAGVPASMLGDAAGNLHDYRDDIIASLDFVFTGI